MTQDKERFSDNTLRKSILAKFADEHTGFANLRVGVMNGIVHLAGAVTTVEERIVAAELAEGIPGVRGVVNRIEAPGAPRPGRSIHLDLSGSSPSIGKEARKLGRE